MIARPVTRSDGRSRATLAPIAADATLIAMDVGEMEQAAARASQLLKALANQHRLMILCHLTKGERSVGELERVIGLSQSALSQHLARLREDGLVQTRRAAQTIYYAIAGDAAPRVIGVLYDIYCAQYEHGGLEAPAQAGRAGSSLSPTAQRHRRSS